MREFGKKVAENIPAPIGRILCHIPMRFRLGSSYRFFENNISFSNIAEEKPKDYFKSIGDLVRSATSKFEFYREFCGGLEQEFLFSKKPVDFERIPVISKDFLRAIPISTRVDEKFALKRSNTGGSSGEPLSFFIEKDAYAREWAHMHAIWSTFGYRVTDEKLTVRGKNIGSGFYKYNFNQNEFLINAYCPIELYLEELKKLLNRPHLKWLHGYPSAIFSFLKEIEKVDSILFEGLIAKIKGVFLGSEFPSPIYREYLEKYCSLRTISWYGHSEMAVLAVEKDPGSGIYFPFYSYGYPEAIESDSGFRLIGTSFYNYACPFIRYDTGDLISPNFSNGLLESFSIEHGRSAEHVLDKNGRSISLTSLIFGRHHKAFEFCDHIQVKQVQPGKIELLITSRFEIDNWMDLFDFSNSFFDVTYRAISRPVKTRAGKVPLLVRES